jgi:hypothetical protein
MNEKPRGMTPETLEAVMKMMPEDMTGYQLSAFLMLLTDTYSPDASKGITLLLTTGVTYARTCGMGPEKISRILRDVAIHVEEQDKALTKKKVH